MAEPTSKYTTFNFWNPVENGFEAVEIETSALKPGHQSYGETMEYINWYRRTYGEPDIKEPDLKLNRVEKLGFGMIEDLMSNPFRQPETEQELMEELEGGPLSGGPETVSADKYRNTTSMVGQMGLGLLAPGAAARFIPKMGSTALTALGAIGAMGGEKGAQMAQEGSGIRPSPTPPVFAGLTDAAFGMGASAVSGGSRRAARNMLVGRPQREIKQEYEALRRSGVSPTTTQLSERGRGGRIQQLSIDLPYSWIGDKRLRQAGEDITEEFYKYFEPVSRQAAGEAAKASATRGREAWREIGSRKFEDTWAMLPNGKNTLIDIEPIINALMDTNMMDSAVIDQLSRGAPDAAKTLKKFVEEYGTVLPSPPTSPLMGGQPMQRVRFRDAPVGEVERIRKAMGELFRVSEDPVIPITIAKQDRNKIYAGIKESERIPMQELDKATPGLGAEAKFDDTFSYWSENQQADSDYLRSFLRKVDPVEFFNDVERAMKSGKADTLELVMKRIDADPKIATRGARELQDALITKYGLTDDGYFNIDGFRKWWVGMDAPVKDVLFEPGLRSTLDDFAKLGDVFFPESRALGSMFLQQQYERPATLLSKLAPHGMTGGGAALGGGVMAAGGGIPLAAALGATFMAIPSLGTRVMSSPMVLKWVTNAAKVGPRSYADHLGKLVSIIEDTTDDDERLIAMELFKELNQPSVEKMQFEDQVPTGSGLAALPQVNLGGR